MPLTPINYQNTIIYKIQCREKPELIYVGHTTDFTRRKNQHRTVSNCSSSSKYNRKLYLMIRENGGWEMFNMIQIKEYPCENKRQAEAEEDKMMQELKSNLNSCRSFTGMSESDYAFQYRATHKDRKKVVDRIYREKNKEAIKQKKQKKMQCECGQTASSSHMSRHRLSQHHIEFIKSLEKTT